MFWGVVLKLICLQSSWYKLIEKRKGKGSETNVKVDEEKDTEGPGTF